jgi:hypothetical protein
MTVLVQPVMAEEEAQAAVTVLRAVEQRRILVEHDEERIRHAIEAIEHAPRHDPEKPRPAAARHGDPSTSKEAAKAVTPRAGSQRALLLEQFVRVGDRGLTAYEAGGLALGYKGCYWKRVGELEDEGWIVHDGRERVSPESNANRRVFVATPAAHAWRAA